MEEKNLVMTFKDQSRKKTNITVRAIKENLLETDINGVMDKIIEKNIFLSNGGKLVEKVEAKIVTRSTDSIKIS